MPLQIVRNDITKMAVDTIVNAANPSLLGGGGVDGAIHRAAGPRLLQACKTLGGCHPGDAKITRGYNLPCRYVIHTVGPRWKGGRYGERQTLACCYRTCLALAKQHQCQSIAFPLISTGVYGYPREQALQVAIQVIREFLLEQDMMVYLVVFDRDSYQISEALFSDISQYIDDRYVQEKSDVLSRRVSLAPTPKCGDDGYFHDIAHLWLEPDEPTLEQALAQMEESFSQMLLRKIDEKGMTDAQCYKKANIDRKLFSKIRGNAGYKPSKPTVLAFAIALELSLEETKDMLQKAGFAFSHSSKFDIIIEYFIQKGNYDIFEINQALFAFEESLLGS
ncbi:MAG: O-acetyl-ADP-ribose deacetylase [Candidatus Fournierella pullistercoris]|uniref:O-acetyl-ADP-ribose deacetylase n=1 Tax=Candidatus Allofournierella pullistercoris TaxID=2838597 RepID=A0A948T2Z9_9FIRM|nr:O-acetyl-ADP-ribose deacetylase [Candidatus Fournierella pullistercoris]